MIIVSLFLIAALATPVEQPITPEEKELQELIALFTQEDKPANITENALINAAPATSETAVTPVTKPIIITNAIDDDMLKYKHWTGTYSPDVFTVTINGTEIARGAECSMPAETKIIDVMFNYSFMNGVRTGAKTASYQLHENITQANITFSWKEDHKILVDNGTLLKVTA